MGVNMSYEDRARKYQGPNAATFESMGRSLDLIKAHAPEGYAMTQFIEVWSKREGYGALVTEFINLVVGSNEKPTRPNKE